MIGGIAKIFIQLHSNINTKGFSCNGKRLGFALNDGVSWIEIPIQRDSASDSGDVFDNLNNFTIKFATVGISTTLLIYNGKRVVCRYFTKNNEERIIGVDQPAIIKIGYDSGVSLGDDVGMVVSISASTKMVVELIPSVIVTVPDATCYLRADNVELLKGYVVQVTDLSGNGNNAVVDTTLETGFDPTVVSDAINGKPAVNIHHKALKIDSDYIGKTSLWGGGVNSIGYNDEFTILAVVKPISGTMASGIIGNENFYAHIQIITDLNRFTFVSRGTGSANTVFDNYDEFKLWSIRLPISGNIKIRINNGDDNEYTLLGDNEEILNGKINIGINDNANSDQIQIAELRIWDSVLTDDQLNKIEQEVMEYYSL